MKGTLRVTVWQLLSAGRRLGVKGLEFGSFSSRQHMSQAETGDFSCSFRAHNSPPAPRYVLALFQRGNLRKLGKCNG